MTLSFPTKSLISITIILNLLITLTTESNPDGAMLTRFRNIANYDIVLWWLTPYKDEEIRFFGHLPRNGGMTSFTSYVGHRFFWAPPNKQHDVSQRRQFFKIEKDKVKCNQYPSHRIINRLSIHHQLTMHNHHKTCTQTPK